MFLSLSLSFLVLRRPSCSSRAPWWAAPWTCCSTAATASWSALAALVRAVSIQSLALGSLILEHAI